MKTSASMVPSKINSSTMPWALMHHHAITEAVSALLDDNSLNGLLHLCNQNSPGHRTHFHCPSVHLR